MTMTRIDDVTWSRAAAEVGTQPTNAEDARVLKYLGLFGGFRDEVDVAAQQTARNRATALRANYGDAITSSRAWKIALAEAIGGFVAGDVVRLTDARDEGEWIVVAARYNKRYSVPGTLTLRRPGRDSFGAEQRESTLITIAEALTLVRRNPESKWASGY
jgi:hypothetical protein